MTDPICEHCGETHPLATPYCPNTGRKIEATIAATASPPTAETAARTAAKTTTEADAAETSDPGTAAPRSAPRIHAVPDGIDVGVGLGAGATTAEVGVYDLLVQAFTLYRQHARMLLTAAGVIFIPGALAHACARAAILTPTVVVQVVQDPATHRPIAAPLSVGTLGVGFPAMMLGLLALAVTGLLLHGVIVPLVQGALALATADRLGDGRATWQEVWTLLFRRLGTVLSAVVPAALLTGVGFFFLLIPGLMLAFFFSFAPLVALFEGVGGTAALRRSYELVRSDWLRMLILLFVFAVISWLTRGLAGMFLGGLVGGRLLQDLLTLFVLPIPVIASVLLYFDIRRKREGYDRSRLADDLDRIRAAS